MASGNQGPFWNQDTIMAAGLAFAGVAVLQGKLFPVVARLNEPLLSKLIVWWPTLLIVGGLALWLSKAFGKQAHRNGEPACVRLGVTNESGRKR
jgi:hypothetical protein